MKKLHQICVSADVFPKVEQIKRTRTFDYLEIHERIYEVMILTDRELHKTTSIV